MERNHQVGGTHYEECGIQPVDYIHANKLDFNEGCVVKYITRHRKKNGAEDIAKIMQYCQIILRQDYGLNSHFEIEQKD